MSNAEETYWWNGLTNGRCTFRLHLHVYACWFPEFHSVRHPDSHAEFNTIYFGMAAVAEPRKESWLRSIEHFRPWELENKTINPLLGKPLWLKDDEISVRDWGR
tara:strand:- start:723 stop:1034 length:312 start_codon:yes stop_codon:yes gene_type:complete